MRNRRRSFPKRQLWATWRDFVKAERWEILKFWTTIPAMCLAISVLWPGWETGFISGALLFFMVGVTGFVFAISTGGLAQLLGVMAEGFTREEVEAAAKEQSVWSAVHNLELNSGDLDHLILAPAGCLAIETKYYGSRFSADLVGEHARQTQRIATRAKGFMNTVGRPDVPVRAAALVVWGRMAPKGISERDGVAIVNGTELRAWLGRYRTGPLGEDIAERVRQDLERYAANRWEIASA